MRLSGGITRFIRTAILAGPILLITLWQRLGCSSHASVVAEVRMRLEFRDTERQIRGYLRRHAEFDEYCRTHSGMPPT